MTQESSTSEREETLRDELMSAGTTAADEWLAARTHRRMSEVNRRRLAGHIMNALWDRIVDAALGIAHMVSEDVESERDRLLVEVEQLRRPLLAVEVDTDPNDEDVARWRTKYEMTVAGEPRHTWLLPSGAEVRLVEWTVGDELALFTASRTYVEAVARRLVQELGGGSVLWRREAAPWAKAEASE